MIQSFWWKCVLIFRLRTMIRTNGRSEKSTFNQKIARVLMFLLLSLLSVSLLVSCEEKIVFTKDFHLNPTPLYKPYVNYLVFTESYMRVYTKKDPGSTVIDIARKGEIFAIVKPEGKNKFGYYWFKVRHGNRDGWILTFNPILAYSLDRALYLAKYLH